MLFFWSLGYRNVSYYVFFCILTHLFSTYRTGGKAFQLRALDFDTTGPFKDFPQVTVYHPSEGHAWAQVGWPGNVGVLTGFSDQQLAISEIGVCFFFVFLVFVEILFIFDL
jgi:hypothetical protein